MLKKLCVFGILLYLCTGLSACGNPLKEVPEAAGENIYDSEEETTENELADNIIEELLDGGNLPGDEVISFVVNDRDDDEDSKDRTDLKIGITTQTDYAEYTYYYVVECRYSKERGWRVKDYELDGDEESLITPTEGISEEEIEDAIMNGVYSGYYGDTYVCFDEGEITDITVNSEDIIPGIVNASSYEEEYPREDLTVTFTWNNDFCSYTRELSLEYRFDIYYESSDETKPWQIYEYELSEDYTTELSEETLEQLSDDRMIADLAAEECKVGSYSDVILTEDMIGSYTFGDYEFSGNWCFRTAEITLADTELFTVKLTVDYNYEYDGSSWEFAGVGVTTDAQEQKLAGNYSGEAVDYDGEVLATIYYSILEVDDEGNVSGVVKWVPSGTDAANVEGVEFTGSYYKEYLSLYLEFEDFLIRDGWFMTFSHESLYYNPSTQTLESTSYGRTYSLSRTE